jgi:WD40 repeat protein
MSTVTYKPVDLRPFEQTPEQVVLSPDGSHLAVSFWNSRKIIVTKDDGSQVTHTFRREVEKIALANNGRIVVSGLTKEYGIFKDLTENTCYDTAACVMGVAISASGDRIATGRENGIFSVRDASTRCYEPIIREKTDHEISCINLSPDGKLVGIGTKEGTVLLYDLTSKKFTQTLAAKGETFSLFVSNGGKFSITTSLHRYISDKWQYLRPVSAGTVSARECAYIDSQGTWLWDEKREQQIPHKARKIRLSPEGSTCVTADRHMLQVWYREGANSPPLSMRTKSPIEHLRVGDHAVAWSEADSGQITWMHK